MKEIFISVISIFYGNHSFKSRFFTSLNNVCDCNILWPWKPVMPVKKVSTVLEKACSFNRSNTSPQKSDLK